MLQAQVDSRIQELKECSESAAASLRARLAESEAAAAAAQQQLATAQASGALSLLHSVAMGQVCGALWRQGGCECVVQPVLVPCVFLDAEER